MNRDLSRPLLAFLLSCGTPPRRLHDDPPVRSSALPRPRDLGGRNPGEGRAAGPGDESAVAPAPPTAPDLRWQDFFTDDRLRALIDLALANNRDLRVATLNIERAAALYRSSAPRSTHDRDPGLGEKYRIPEKMGDNGEAKTVSSYSSSSASPPGS